MHGYLLSCFPGIEGSTRARAGPLVVFVGEDVEVPDDDDGGGEVAHQVDRDQDGGPD